MSYKEQSIELTEDIARVLFSSQDSFLELIKKMTNVSARARGTELYIKGPIEQINKIENFIKTLEQHIKSGEELNKRDIKLIFESTSNYSNDIKSNIYTSESDSHNKVKKNYANINCELFEEIITTYSGKPVKPKTPAQNEYIQSIRNNFITIAIGPAGTGKTYLAVAMAVKALKEKQVNKVILSRPTIEAGEKLGFLPGDILEKVDPHFRPLYDALQEFLGHAKFNQYLKNGVIEITPLGFMRGRTFNEAFIVLDEAQNTTITQMKMFLTRLGFGSKMVITGDNTQIDLPNHNESSLINLHNILANIDGLAFVKLTSKDVIRHEIVRKIIQAFDIFTTNSKLNYNNKYQKE